jgi:hypothetical protein
LVGLRATTTAGATAVGAVVAGVVEVGAEAGVAAATVVEEATAEGAFQSPRAEQILCIYRSLAFRASEPSLSDPVEPSNSKIHPKLSHIKNLNGVPEGVGTPFSRLFCIHAKFLRTISCNRLQTLAIWIERSCRRYFLRIFFSYLHEIALSLASH